MKPILPVAASLIVGVCAGVAAHMSGLAPQSGARLETDAAETVGDPSGGVALRSPDAGGEDANAPISGVSDVQSFKTLSPEQQKEAVLRLNARIEKGGYAGSTRDTLLLARVVKDLSFEQVSALLEAMPKPAPGRRRGDSGRYILLERMAGLNPQATLESGKQSGDNDVVRAALGEIAKKNVGEALRAMAQLPEKHRASAFSTHEDGLSKPGGNLSEVAAALRENPQLLDAQGGVGYGVQRLLGQVLAKEALADPVAAVAELKRLSVDLAASKGSKTAQNAFLAYSFSELVRNLRAESPAAASKAFDAIPASDIAQVSQWMLPLEAAARYKQGGADAAIQFAEKQLKDDSLKSAASGVWWGFAQQDRAAAMQWIDSLPQGAFRDGVLTGVAQDAQNRTNSWGDIQVAVDAAANLPSRTARLDYYATLMNSSRISTGMPRSEFIATLPLSEGDKQELLRRMAPIKPK